VCTNCVPLLPAEDVTKRRKRLTWWRVGRWSYFPLLFFTFLVLL
jgi:hypothetical protein